MKPLPTQEELRRVLAYDPATGLFRWQANINMRGRLQEPGTIRAGYRDICVNGTHYGSHRLVKRRSANTAFTQTTGGSCVEHKS